MVFGGAALISSRPTRTVDTLRTTLLSSTARRRSAEWPYPPIGTSSSGAHRRQRDGIEFSGVIYASQSTLIGPLIDDLELVAEASNLAELANTLLLLPLP
jgi:hypothetical protein